MLVGEKYIVGSAQGNRRFVRIISSCPADVEIFLTSGADGEEEYITTLPAVVDEFERHHNVYHGDVGDTFKAYIPTSREYQRSMQQKSSTGSDSFHVHQQFTIPEDDRPASRNEEGEMQLHEFHVTCNKLVLKSNRGHDVTML